MPAQTDAPDLRGALLATVALAMLSGPARAETTAATTAATVLTQATVPAAGTPPGLTPLPVLDAAETADAIRLLRLQMRLSLGTSLVSTDPLATRRAIGMGRAMLARLDHAIERPQLLLLVDRAPAVQRLWVLAAMPGGLPWTVVGAVRISSGKPGRLEHFKTPVGVFTNGRAILGYRAQGTLNEHGIRGIGVAGMRVWDFGWQTTEDWRKPDALTAVRLEMHATDPTFLESRLGRPDSEACIRIPAAFNQLMDRTGLIDAQLLAIAGQDRAVAALLPKDRTPSPLAGDTVVVVDSAEPTATASDPVRAEAINRHFADWLAQQAAPSPTLTGAAPVPAPGALSRGGIAGGAPAEPAAMRMATRPAAAALTQPN